MSDIKELTELIDKFVEERDWKQFHNHKDMALSLVLEATEVLEHFQWKVGMDDIEKHVKENKEELADELADVMIYLLELANNSNIDIKSAVKDKLKKNALKYPVEKAKGSAEKYDKL